MKRVFLIVLDSLGIGEMPDAAAFGDKDCNTLKRISTSPEFCIDNLIKMGLGNIDGVNFLKKAELPSAAFAQIGRASCRERV